MAKKVLSPTEKADKKLDQLEKENEGAVKVDHFWGRIGVIAIAIAALLGMAADALLGLLNGALDMKAIVEIAVALIGVLVMNVALLSAARNIRRSEQRGEKPKHKDQIIMYAVLVIESISFGYMLWRFEGKPDILSIQFLQLAARAGVIPYATVYLELQKETPIDLTDIETQRQIGLAKGSAQDTIRQAYDDTVPTFFKLAALRSNTGMSREMDQTMQNLINVDRAYRMWQQEQKMTPEIMALLDGSKHSQQKAIAAPTEDNTETSNDEIIIDADPIIRPPKKEPKSTKKKTAKVVRLVQNDDGSKGNDIVDRIVERKQNGEKITIAIVMKDYKVSQSSASKYLALANNRVTGSKRTAGPISLRGSNLPPAAIPVDDDNQDDDQEDLEENDDDTEENAETAQA